MEGLSTNETSQDSVLSILFSFFANTKQSKFVISTTVSPWQISAAVAVNVTGALLGEMTVGALQSIAGGVVSTTVIHTVSLAAQPLPSSIVDQR